ncbi:PA2928 family protein [Amycolatopsis magusensis]|uniref:PQQ-like domain-containing protein n=1 Tax=Amycolatopsis magusensis TaxID=882444 RepID=A0ABS4Q510_9PSEU|nr:PA2928 family protein [Amycolatopsis magusensis]MBP2186688.1 hypothetical protein [Amycolatopsis magusensis]
MYQNPPQYAPAPSLYDTPPRRRRRKVVPLPMVAFLGIFALLFFGGSYLVSPEARIHAQPGVAFAELGGRDVVLVPYERQGARGMFQLLTQDMFQVRLAAVDPASDEVLWDTQLSDELIWEASVLGAGRDYAYVATDSGLMILDLSDGSVEVQGEDVPGLDGAYLTSRAAYAYDAEGRRILALTSSGAVRAIELDQTKAVAVDDETASAWADRLSADRPRSTTFEIAGTEAGLLPSSSEQVVLEDVGIGELGSVLFRGPEDGRKIQVSETAFPHARLVIADGTAAGAATGHVLVQHRLSLNDTGLGLSLVSLATGEVTGSLPISSAPEGAVVGPDGTTVVTAGDAVVLARGDGSVVPLEIGASDLFGSA